MLTQFREFSFCNSRYLSSNSHSLIKQKLDKCWDDSISMEYKRATVIDHTMIITWRVVHKIGRGAGKIISIPQMIAEQLTRVANGVSKSVVTTWTCSWRGRRPRPKATPPTPLRPKEMMNLLQLLLFVLVDQTTTIAATEAQAVSHI